jgi:integrase
MGKLTDRAVRAFGPGRHGDGDGLMLVVSPTGGRKWVLRYQMNGRRRDMGLGSYPEVELKTARIAAAAARSQAAIGIDPLTARDQARKASRPVPTFAEVATDVIAEAKARTANAKVAYQWERHLGPAYCGQILKRPLNEITTVDIAALLKPVWRTKPEVARKLLPAIRRVFEQGRILLRDKHGIVFQNPALWADLKAMGFEQPVALSRGRHPSLPYDQLPAFMTALRSRDAVSARLLEFLILTNVRTGGALAAQWKEIDTDAAIWIIPIENLKDKKTRKEPFRVPLSKRVIEILEELKKGSVSDFVFPNSAGMPMSNMAMLTMLKRMNSGQEKWLDPTTGKPIVPHGFRATFRTWSEETTHFPNAIVEEAMGHVVGSSVERAYRRTDVLEKRRELMNTWAFYCQPDFEKAMLLMAE